MPDRKNDNINAVINFPNLRLYKHSNKTIILKIYTNVISDPYVFKNLIHWFKTLD